MISFDCGIEEINERLMRVYIYIEFREHRITSSELHEAVIYRNAEGVAVIYSDIYDDHDFLETKIIDEFEENIDKDNIHEVARYILKKMLVEFKEYLEEQEHLLDDLHYFKIFEKIDEKIAELSS